MRFLLFDRVTVLEPRKRIEGVKCITLADECLRDHFPRRAVFPGSLVIEAMVQVTGWLAITAHEYGLSVVLSVLEQVEVPSDLAPGTALTLHGELMGTNPKGSMARAWAEVDGRRVATIGRVLYAHVPHPDPEILRHRFRYLGGQP